MSATDKEEGSATGVRGSAAPFEGMPIEFVRYLREIALGDDGSLTPDAKIQIGLRDASERSHMLEQLIREIAPQDVDPVVWTRWFKGGKPPFQEVPKKPALKKPTLPSERPSNILGRTTPRVARQAEAVAEARAKLEQEEQHLALLKAHDNAALLFTVIDQLIAIVEPVFAMGPAWTLLRCMTAYVSDEAADKATPMLLGDEKPEGMAKYRAIREHETKQMLDSLDWFSGYEPFEEALRKAIRDVCRDFEHKRDDAGRDGRRPRSTKAMLTEAHPKAQKAAGEVLRGLNAGEAEE